MAWVRLTAASHAGSPDVPVPVHVPVPVSVSVSVPVSVPVSVSVSVPVPVPALLACVCACLCACAGGQPETRTRDFCCTSNDCCGTRYFDADGGVHMQPCTGGAHQGQNRAQL